MKSLHRRLSSILVLALSACLLPSGAAELRIAMEGKFPPFEELDAKGNLKGFNVDIANALCREMKAQCKLVRFDWDDLIPALKANKADAILASMSITAERLREVDFTARYAQTPAFFFARAHRIPYAFLTPKRLAGLKIGVQADTTYDSYVSAKYAATSPIVRFKSTDELYDALAGAAST
ncbi:transporter substrate-binding domain-containing protein [Chitinimonas koreensis]|uniref:transporter substrate-binding domain-containing protein n=1 Tax=Chitinimonas koreensis TaxID=356302 RepID=UPI0022400AE2|nr:transporter substrate-binding domain-containing protein [Chitinimonas koreensis]